MSSGSDEAPAKKTRKRSREDSAEGFSVTDQGHTQYQQGAVWFDDGNVILVAEATAFRIYRGVLMGVSEVFRDMFMIPQPPDAERWEGCPIVHLSDTAADLNHVLSVLYKVGGVDRGLWGYNNVPKFTTIAAMLRLGQKYAMDTLRGEAISRLRTCFPEKLDDFQNRHSDSELDVDWAEGQYFLHDSIDLQTRDAIAVIGLARSYDLPLLLPSAFYVAVQAEYADLVHGYYDEDGRHWKLSPEDLFRYFVGRDALHSRDLDCLSAKPVLNCSTLQACDKEFENFRSKVIEKHINEYFSSLLDFTIVGSLVLCSKCSHYYRRKHTEKRKTLWAELPKMFNLQGLEWAGVPAGVGNDGVIDGAE